MTWSGGCARVNNILGTSRGIGDAYLKGCVIPNPEVRAQELRPGDDFLVVATDGLWDVMSTSEVCTVALQAGDARSAARALSDAAIARGSEDNVSVVVVDLRQGPRRVCVLGVMPRVRSRWLLPARGSVRVAVAAATCGGGCGCLYCGRIPHPLEVFAMIGSLRDASRPPSEPFVPGASVRRGHPWGFSDRLANGNLRMYVFIVIWCK